MTLKSHMSIWTIFAKHLSVNDKSLSTARRRAEQGLDFFTVDLPSLGKSLDLALDTGLFVVPPKFKAQKGSLLPAFLYEKFIRIFYKDGYIRYDPQGIKELRQLLYMFYKFESPATASQEAAAYAKFAETDALVKQGNWPATIFRVRSTFRSLLPTEVLDIRPHHSNGATADGVSNAMKRVTRRYIPELMGMYDISYFFQCKAHFEEWRKTNSLIISHPVSKVTLVPKDSRGPRIICMEPHERMFIQKGLMQLLYDHIELVSPAKGYINFTDQSINRRLAYSASIDRKYATIDLKDASDMVSWELIKKLATQEWCDALTATRSTIARTPYGDIELKKFAPMGSALCFPIEAILFYSIARLESSEVYVYGDDIIVPREDADRVIAALESYGLVINHSKTLQRGLFRESCGAEFYNGYDISYVKCRSYGLAQFVAFCNLVAEHHGLEISDQLMHWYEDTYATQVFRKAFSDRCFGEPLVYYTNFTASSDVFFRRRYNKNLQRYEYRRLTERAVRLDCSKLSEYDRYFDALTQKETAVQPELYRKQKRLLSDIDPIRVKPRLSAQADPRDVKPRTSFTWVV